MAALTFTPPEFEAFVACWELGHGGMPDHRWFAVELAIHDALADMDGVDLEIDDVALADAKSGFAAGWQGFSPANPDEESLVEHIEGAAVVLDIVPAPGLRH